MDFLIMIVAAVIVFGKLAAKSGGEGNKKRTQNVGPTAEEWAERERGIRKGQGRNAIKQFKQDKEYERGKAPPVCRRR